MSHTDHATFELPANMRRHAAAVDLVYVNSSDEGITRHPWGKGFTYRFPSGRTVRCKRTRQRIDSLAVPPAWREVVICRLPNGHLQAIGTDAAKRRQYIYHPKWEELRAITKFDRMNRFGEVLPRIRRRIRRDLRHKKLSKQLILAATVRLIDKARIRIGSHRYLHDNASHGAITLLPEHVEIDDREINLQYPGKGGKERKIQLRDAKVAEIIGRCDEIEGQFLFQYYDDCGNPCIVDSGSVNEYLQEISGEDVTAKDYRTWWGSVIALEELAASVPDVGERWTRGAISNAVSTTAEVLGNTKTVCRSSYIHPGILAAAETGELHALLAKPDRDRSELTQAEQKFLDLLAML